MRTLSLLLASLLVSGCALVTDPDPSADIGTPLPIVYASTRSAQAPEGATSPPTVRSAAGGIEILGLFHLGTPCHTLDAGVERDGNTLHVTVRATAWDGFCIQVTDVFAYKVAVTDLESREYRVLIDHAYRHPAWRSRVLETSVTVP